MPKKQIQPPRVSYGEGQKVLKCSICSRSFLTLQGLDKHYKSAHEKRTEQKSKISRAPFNSFGFNMPLPPMNNLGFNLQLPPPSSLGLQF